MRLWPTRESFPDLPVINRGLGGAQIPDVLHYYDTVVKRYAPRVVVFYCGDNDIADGRSVEQVVHDFNMLVERLHSDLPKSQLVYVPIKPSIARWKRWPEMKTANASIRELIDRDDRLYYADTASPLVGDDGQPHKALFLDDGLHLNAEGYHEWTRVLRPVIERTMK